jgi:hypothetical protein
MNKKKQRKRYNKGIRQDYTYGGRVKLEEGGIPDEPYTEPPPEEKETTTTRTPPGGGAGYEQAISRAAEEAVASVVLVKGDGVSGDIPSRSLGSFLGFFGLFGLFGFLGLLGLPAGPLK